MRFTRVVALVLAVGLTAACSQPKPRISVTAMPQTATVGNGDCTNPPVKLVITGQVSGGPFEIGMDPAPIVDATQALLTATPGEMGQSEIDTTVNGAEIDLYMCAPTTPGDVKVTASVVDSYGVQVSATTTVKFVAPPVASLGFSCAAKNIDAFLNTASNMAVRCQATAVDNAGKALPNAAIQFLAEAGTVTQNVADNGTNTYTYFPHADGSAHAAPAAVAPFSGEPQWTDNGTIHSPRQGLVTLVAYTRGTNTDTGDMFAGEPFVDANDNGQYDPGEDFFDVNGDGTWNSTQSDYIWTQYKILWSGAISSNPQVAKVSVVGGSGYGLTLNGPPKTITFQVVDDNFNALAANDAAADNITWQLSPEGIVTYGPGQGMMTPMQNTYGIDIDPITLMIRNPMEATSYLKGVDYTVAVQDARMPMDMMGAQSYTVNGMINRTGSVDDQGIGTDQVGSEMTQSVGGAVGD